MESFKIQIAGITFEVQPLFMSTRDYCRNYLTDSSPSYLIVVSEDDLAHEQMMLDIEAVEEGIKIRKFTGLF